VETVGLENRYTRKGIGGSNPSLSATFLLKSSCRSYNRWVALERNMAAKYLLVTAANAAAVSLLLLLRVHLNLTSAALALLLVVTACAVRWGPGPGVAAAIFSGLCFNFFFIPPVYTFNIAHPQDWTAFLVFCATALLV